MQDQIHYGIIYAGKTLLDGRTPHPPAKGDVVVYEGVEYVVLLRTWRTAGDVLGPFRDSWNYGESDLVCVDIVVDRLMPGDRRV